MCWYRYPQGGPYHQYAAGSAPYTETVYQRDNEAAQHGSPAAGSSIAFRDPEESSGHDLAYQGYQNYNKKK